jgi:hypothetical protein
VSLPNQPTTTNYAGPVARVPRTRGLRFWISSQNPEYAILNKHFLDNNRLPHYRWVSLMDVRLHSLPARASSLRKPAMALGTITLIAMLAISVFAESWENKDWTQWSSQDCYHIMATSPWAVIGPEVTTYANGSPGHSVVGRFTPKAFVVSSLVMR